MDMILVPLAPIVIGPRFGRGVALSRLRSFLRDTSYIVDRLSPLQIQRPSDVRTTSALLCAPFITIPLTGQIIGSLPLRYWISSCREANFISFEAAHQRNDRRALFRSHEATLGNY